MVSTLELSCDWLIRNECTILKVFHFIRVCYSKAWNTLRTGLSSLVVEATYILVSLFLQLFVAAALILTLYVLVFLVLRGHISFTRHGVHTKRSEDVLSRERIIIAKRMLWWVLVKRPYLVFLRPVE